MEFEDEIVLEETVETQDTAQPQAEETEQQTDVKVEDTKPTETQQEETQVPKIKVKFNHEEKELAHDEAIPLIQKGMNYDKIQEKLNALQSDPRLSKYDRIQQLAEAYEMSDDDLLEALYNQYYESTAKTNGLTPEQVRKDHELKQREQKLSTQEKSIMTQKQEQDMYSKFIQAFPDARAENIKPETWEKVKAGMDLTTAYVQQQNEELQAQIKTLRQNEENAKRAPVGSVTAHGSKEVAEEDDFLKGFNSI